MFDFRSKILNPVLGKITEGISAALEITGAPARIERLLELKENAEITLGKIDAREDKKTLVGGVMMLGGVIFAIVSLAAFPEAVMATPILLGLGLTAAGVGTFVKSVNNSSALWRDKKAVLEKIDRSVFSAASPDLNAAATSPRFLKALQQKFNAVAEPDKEYDQIIQRAKISAATLTR